MRNILRLKLTFCCFTNQLSKNLLAQCDFYRMAFQVLLTLVQLEK